MRPRGVRPKAVMVTLFILAVSCTGHGGSLGPTPRQRSAAPAPTMTRPAIARLDPRVLIGRWRVVAAGERHGVSLILGEGLRLFRPCGVLDGTWAADHSGLFVGEIYGGDGRCFRGRATRPTAAWLQNAVAYRRVSTGLVLLDRTSKVVARLVPGAHPTVGPDRVASDAAAPTLTTVLRRRLREPAPLPASVHAASPATVTGRWQAVGPRRGNPTAYAEFDSDGTWRATDGCNGTGGRYAVGPNGELLTTNGGTTLVGCDNSPIVRWVIDAGRVATAPGHLLFYGKQGHLLGRCVRR